MMSIIEEVPLDIEEATEDTQETVEKIAEEIQAIPKKRGRPAGAKNKKKIDEAPVEVPPVVEKAKVVKKVKAAPKKKAKPIMEEDSSSEDEPPPKRQRVQEMDRQALAAEMLQILAQQRGGRATARREHYATWFQ